jgi:hypothetical protein
MCSRKHFLQKCYNGCARNSEQYASKERTAIILLNTGKACCGNGYRLRWINIPDPRASLNSDGAVAEHLPRHPHLTL